MSKTSWKRAMLLLVAGISIVGVSYTAAAAFISPEEAQSIAIQHAGVNAANVDRVHVKEDREHGTPVYEVEFLADGTKFEYDIAQDSGDIVKSSQKHKERQDAAAYPGSGSALSLDAARNQVLARVPGAAAGDVRIHPDSDHGRQTYEGKVYFNGIEYEFEIDAATGQFLEWEEDRH